ncbi:2'-5' RNA ligase family protein [Sphingomonas sp. PP-CC-3A-396]|uniref:2'-5' RNA ligase family protein n=1 Tax=Sphingomonas sp. PP-CC-3A-396 TaxID=2135655 RepID=UPI001045B49D|nr:2'-5' RNA ligase family protein [Sphingomonas sp. PP-CC-3A-396]TCQ05735.1 2'-5' RNA ligase superfamily protein [Sphingomonas sp. PP-CC-3A-396]
MLFFKLDASSAYIVPETEASIVAYAVYLEVDPDTSNKFDWLSDVIAKIDPSISIPRRFGHSHHLTIGVYKNIDLDKITEALAYSLSLFSAIDIIIPSIGCFPGTSSVLFAAPLPTKAMIEFHELYHGLVGTQHGSLPHYCPGTWFPHITIASGMTSRQVGDALSMIAEDWHPIEGSLNTAKVVSLTPTEVMWSNGFRCDVQS